VSDRERCRAESLEERRAASEMRLRTSLRLSTAYRAPAQSLLAYEDSRVVKPELTGAVKSLILHRFA